MRYLSMLLLALLVVACSDSIEPGERVTDIDVCNPGCGDGPVLLVFEDATINDTLESGDCHHYSLDSGYGYGDTVVILWGYQTDSGKVDSVRRSTVPLTEASIDIPCE